MVIKYRQEVKWGGGENLALFKITWPTLKATKFYRELINKNYFVFFSNVFMAKIKTFIPNQTRNSRWRNSQIRNLVLKYKKLIRGKKVVHLNIFFFAKSIELKKKNLPQSHRCIAKFCFKYN